MALQYRGNGNYEGANALPISGQTSYEGVNALPISGHTSYEGVNALPIREQIRSNLQPKKTDQQNVPKKNENLVVLEEKPMEDEWHSEIETDSDEHDSGEIFEIFTGAFATMGEFGNSEDDGSASSDESYDFTWEPKEEAKEEKTTNDVGERLNNVLKKYNIENRTVLNDTIKPKREIKPLPPLKLKS